MARTRALFIASSVLVVRLRGVAPAQRRAVDLLTAAAGPLALEILGVLGDRGVTPMTMPPSRTPRSYRRARSSGIPYPMRPPMSAPMAPPVPAPVSAAASVPIAMIGRPGTAMPDAARPARAPPARHPPRRRLPHLGPPWCQLGAPRQRS